MQIKTLVLFMKYLLLYKVGNVRIIHLMKMILLNLFVCIKWNSTQNEAECSQFFSKNMELERKPSKVENQYLCTICVCISKIITLCTGFQNDIKR